MLFSMTGGDTVWFFNVLYRPTRDTITGWEEV
jgi:hypothetical protein